MINHEKGESWFSRMYGHILALGKETWLTSWELIRITIPIAIATKILEEFGVISILSQILEPVMELVGLPGSLGIVWATAMLTSIYGGITVFAALAPTLVLSDAQVTVLCAMILIAHSLPIELSVSKRAGARVLPIAVLRLAGGLVYGFILHHFCQSFGIWQERAALIFKSTTSDVSIAQWAWAQLQNQFLIVFIIFCIVVGMHIFRALKLLTLLENLLAPVLPWFGMGRQAAPITVVGMLMGIGYGGALIIRETAKGKMDRCEIFNSMALMGLCHGLIEDTLVMAAIGGKLGGIFWGRILFSLIVAFMLVKITVWLGRKRTASVQ